MPAPTFNWRDLRTGEVRTFKMMRIIDTRIGVLDGIGKIVMKYDLQTNRMWAYRYTPPT